MMISKKLLKHLEKNGVKYAVVPHRTVYTAYDLAITLKRDLGSVVKTILISADKGYALVMLPANRRVDLKKIKKVLEAKQVGITKESAQKKVLAITNAAVTPFAVLYGEFQVIADRPLTRIKKLIVPSGTFEESLEMNWESILKGTQATVADIGETVKVKKAKKAKVTKKAIVKTKKK